MNYRNLRVSNLIRDELGKIILKEMEFPGLVTITRVDTDKKLEGALVRVSVMPSNEAEEVVKRLKGFQPRLQFLLARKLNIKPMPELRFEIDHGMEKAAEIEKIVIEDEDEFKD